jgi:serine/threonine protein kinase
VHGGNLLLTDFGTARDWTKDGARITTYTSAGITPAYCSPEEANCEMRGDRTDIWSPGCVFLEITTVLRGDTVDQMFLSTDGEPFTVYQNESSCYYGLYLAPQK